jgi:hypothetical protein
MRILPRESLSTKSGGDLDCSLVALPRRYAGQFCRVLCRSLDLLQPLVSTHFGMINSARPRTT